MLNLNVKNSATNFTRHLFTGLRRLMAFTLTALLLAPTLSLPSLAQNRNTTKRKVQDETVLVNPLAKSDPRAQLDQQLINAQPMPPINEQEKSLTSVTKEPTAVEFNMATRQEVSTVGQIDGAQLKKQAESLQNGGTVPFTGLVGARPLTADLELSSEQAATKQNTSESYLCIDDKQPKYETWEYPWSTEVKLFMTFPNGGVYVGSGTMIASKYVITHQNNVYYPAFGGFPTSIEVIPGLDGYYKPFGSAYAVYMRYYYHGNSNLGLITLDRHIGFSTGWLGWGNFSDSTIESYYGHIAGYPVSKDAGRVLYYDYGSPQVLGFDRGLVGMLFLPGEMGAGAYLKTAAGYRYVWGVSASPYYCSTTVDRITGWMQDQFSYVIANGL